LLSSLGRLETLRQIIGTVEGRSFPRTDWQRMYNRASEALSFMEHNPGQSYRCGSFSLFHVGSIRTNNHTLSQLLTLDSPESGFSMGGLAELSDKHGLDFVAVERPAGSELNIPS